MRSSASEFIEIPKFFTFSVFGKFSGSASEKDMNYKVVPEKREDGNVLNCYVWSGRNCIDKSENVQHTEYPLTQEGFDEMLAFLDNEYKSRPDCELIWKEKAKLAAELADDFRL
ncbi:MAG: hypothetical protein II936_05555 [Oscillospiraceae bacterium]|nr:hypothetical protein [Oscillospiraceae bacterium]